MYSAVIFSVLVLLLAACAPAAVPEESTAVDEAIEFKIAASADIDTTDPHISQLLIFNDILRLNVFNSLVRYGPSLEPVGDLAESWSNPDDRTYIFTLRPGT